MIYTLLSRLVNVMEKDLVKVNFRLSAREVDAIKTLVNKNLYSSISDFVREAIERLIDDIEHNKA